MKGSSRIVPQEQVQDSERDQADGDGGREMQKSYPEERVRGKIKAAKTRLQRRKRRGFEINDAEETVWFLGKGN